MMACFCIHTSTQTPFASQSCLRLLSFARSENRVKYGFRANIVEATVVLLKSWSGGAKLETYTGLPLFSLHLPVSPLSHILGCNSYSWCCSAVQKQGLSLLRTIANVIDRLPVCMLSIELWSRFTSFLMKGSSFSKRYWVRHFTVAGFAKRRELWIPAVYSLYPAEVVAEAASRARTTPCWPTAYLVSFIYQAISASIFHKDGCRVGMRNNALQIMRKCGWQYLLFLWRDFASLLAASVLENYLGSVDAPVLPQ